LAGRNTLFLLRNDSKARGLRVYTEKTDKGGKDQDTSVKDKMSHYCRGA